LKRGLSGQHLSLDDAPQRFDFEAARHDHVLAPALADDERDEALPLEHEHAPGVDREKEIAPHRQIPGETV
jgi:hypothetical protein